MSEACRALEEISLAENIDQLMRSTATAVASYCRAKVGVVPLKHPPDPLACV